MPPREAADPEERSLSLSERSLSLSKGHASPPGRHTVAVASRSSPCVTGDDGAVSSAGAFGFYPWLNQARDTYGILARKDEAGTGFASVRCGRLIRKAWETGVAR